MKNRLSDLQNHLFAQIERLSDESVTGEKLESEIERAHAIANVSGEILKIAAVQIRAAEIVQRHGHDDPAKYLPRVYADKELPTWPVIQQ